MKSKKESKKFTIQFNQDNPLHIQVVDILNGLNPRGKARFIADAILHYVSCDKTHGIEQPSYLNEKAIETIVERILNNRGGTSTNRTLSNDTKQSVIKPTPEDIEFADSLDDIDSSLIGSMLDAVEMLKRK